MKSKKSNANFSVANDTPVASIILSYDSKNEKFNIGQSTNGTKEIWISKNGHDYKNSSHVIKIDTDDEGG